MLRNMINDYRNIVNHVNYIDVNIRITANYSK